MKCESCNGTGDGAKKNDHNCSICNGTGCLCDGCGESCEIESNICELCLEEQIRKEKS